MVIKKLPRGLKTTVNIPFKEEPPNVDIMPHPEPPNINLKFKPEPPNVQIGPDIEDELIHGRHPRKRLI